MLPDERPSSTHVERILAMRRVRVLATLPASELAVAAEYARERFFPKGSTLLRGGEPVRAVYVIVEGRVHVRRRGREMGHAGPGAGLGLFGLLARDPEGLDASAETDTFALEFDADTAFEIFEDRFPVLRHLLRYLCGDLIEASRRTPQPGPPPWKKLQGIPARDLDFVDRIIVLRQVPPFARASINSLAELSRSLSEVHFEQGTTLWNEGDPARGVLLVVSGEVLCTCSTLEEPFIMGPGAPLGTVEAVAGRPRWYDAVTRTRIVVLSGDVEGLFDAFEDNFEMALDYMAAVSHVLVDLLEARAERGETPLGSLYDCENA